LFKSLFDKLNTAFVEHLKDSMGCQAAAQRPAEMISETRVAQVLRKAKRIVVLTGAGAMGPQHPADLELLASSDMDMDSDSPQPAPPRSGRLPAFASVLVASLVFATAGFVVGQHTPSGRRPPGGSEAPGGRVGLVEANGSLPPTHALIVWAENPNRCVGVQGGLKAVGRTVHLALTDCSGDALVFTVPTPVDTMIRVSGRPDLCLDNPGQTELQLWDCNAPAAETQANMQFYLLSDGENRTVGTIRPQKNSSKCMDVPRDEIGAPVQMWECMNSTHEAFMLQVMKEGAKGEPAAAQASPKKPLRHAGGSKNSKM